MRASPLAWIAFVLITPPACLGAAIAATQSVPLHGPAGLPAQVSPYSAATTRDFLTGCKLDKSSCAAMIGEVLMDRAQYFPTTHICLPDINYADGVEAWLSTHPQAGAMGTEDGIYLALTALYRCGAPNNY